MRKYLDPFKGVNDKLNDLQKGHINNYRFGTKPKIRNPHNKLRYWCPNENMWYVASYKHKICPECGDSHEIILFNEHIHQL